MLFLTLNIGQVLEKWHKEGGELDKQVADYIKSSSSQEEDYVKALFIIDILRDKDSTEKKVLSKAIYENYQRNCIFSDGFPDALKFFALECYIKRHNENKAEYILDKIRDDKVKCMSMYFFARFLLNNGNKKKGKHFFEESITKCQNVVPLWSRDILFR